MPARIFKRKIYDSMLKWKAWSKGRYALLIEGARRIGKSTIAEEFAKKEYDDYLVIDFANAAPEIVDAFNYVADMDQFFLRISTFIGRKLPERKSVIIFDEVQFMPKARQAIKYLVKDGRYDYIETGSLISVKKNVKDILIPSEEHKLAMYPMDFEEFLWAIGKGATYDLIRNLYEMHKPAGDTMHRALMRDFRLYMLVGGMPQAVVEYLDTEDFGAVDMVKRKILDIYIDDFRKIDSSGRASLIFSSIPSQLSRNVTGFKVGSVIENARPSRMGELFADINDSRTVNFAYHANDPNVGMALHADFNNFKMYISDTGLLVSLAFMDGSYTDNDLYRKLLFDKLPTDLGYVFENVVAQMLRAAGHNLFYYTFKTVEAETGRTRTYEIDFIVSHKDKIYPIEVKSSGYKSHKSLDEFQEKYSSRIGRRYLLYTKDLRKDGDLLCLPVYMAALV